MQLSKKPYPARWSAEKIGYLAGLSLLEEVYTSPKPGLVDLYSAGAHHDMDYRTFERSTTALEPYFVEMARQGMLRADCPPQIFLSIRPIGIAAEKAMYQATGGVNTHKGLIFNMGILCGAAGACLKNQGQIILEQLFRIEQQMVKDILESEIAQIQKGNGSSNGEKNLLKYGSRGARGEAISGYESVRRISLPVMLKGAKEEKEWNAVKLETLFSLMSQIEDSNIIARHNPEILKQVQKLAGSFLKEGGAYREDAIVNLKEMDRRFIEQNISAGGCADLLALTIFLFKLLYCSGDTLQ